MAQKPPNKRPEPRSRRAARRADKRVDSPLAPLEVAQSGPHDLDISRIDQEMARLNAPKRVTLTLSVGKRSTPERRDLPLYWWDGAWCSDALIAVRFGGATVYARSLRIAQSDFGAAAELLAREPLRVLHDHEGDGRFRGKRPVIAGWAERAGADGGVSWVGIRVDAAAMNCSPDIYPGIRLRLADLAAKREELLRCSHRDGLDGQDAAQSPIDLWIPGHERAPERDNRHRVVPPTPAFAAAALDAEEQRMAMAERARRIESDLAAVESWRNKPILLLGRSLMYLRDAGIPDRLFPVFRRWIEAVDDRLKAREIARRLRRIRDVDSSERVRLEAEFAERTSFFLNEPVDPSHEVGAKIYRQELSAMRGEIDRLRRRTRIFRWFGDVFGFIAPNVATLVTTGALPALGIAGFTATLPLGLAGFALSRAMLYRFRANRGRAHAAYIKAAAAARRGDSNAFFDAALTANTALEATITTRPFIPDLDAPLVSRAERRARHGQDTPLHQHEAGIDLDRREAKRRDWPGAGAPRATRETNGRQEQTNTASALGGIESPADEFGAASSLAATSVDWAIRRGPGGGTIGIGRGGSRTPLEPIDPSERD